MRWYGPGAIFQFLSHKTARGSFDSGDLLLAVIDVIPKDFRVGLVYEFSRLIFRVIISGSGDDLGSQLKGAGEISQWVMVLRLCLIYQFILVLLETVHKWVLLLYLFLLLLLSVTLLFSSIDRVLWIFKWCKHPCITASISGCPGLPG